MLDKLLKYVAPHSCCGCGNIGNLLCESCKNDIVSEAFSQCLVCLRQTAHDNLCTTCASQYSITGAWCIGERSGTLEALLNVTKFSYAREGLRVCSELYDLSLPYFPPTTVIVPVPTAPSHVRERGFDHTLLMSQQLAKRRNLTQRSYIERTGNETQHFKSRRERFDTAMRSYTVPGHISAPILLIDDIHTTGATIQACVKKLQAAGAEHIYVAVLAKQLPK